MARPVVLLDCDGVLADFVGAALELINDQLGKRFTRDDVTGWDFTASLGLQPDVGAWIKRQIGATKGFASSLDAYPGAVDGVRRLCEVAEVYVVTAPWNSNATWAFERESWLKHNFGIGHDRVIHTSAKHLVHGDILVDDKTSTCKQWRAAWPDGVVLRWSTPHNWREAWDGTSTADWDFVLAAARSVTR